MLDDNRDTVRRLAALARLPLDEERVGAIALALPFIQAGLAALAAIDYGETEPAGRFFPPSPEPR